MTNLPDPDRQYPHWNDPEHARIDLSSGRPEILEAAAALVWAFRQNDTPDSPPTRSCIQSDRLIIWTRLTEAEITDRAEAAKASSEAWEAQKRERAEAAAAEDQRVADRLGVPLEDYLAIKATED